MTPYDDLPEDLNVDSLLKKIDPLLKQFEANLNAQQKIVESLGLSQAKSKQDLLSDNNTGPAKPFLLHSAPYSVKSQQKLKDAGPQTEAPTIEGPEDQNPSDDPTKPNSGPTNRKNRDIRRR